MNEKHQEKKIELSSANQDACHLFIEQGSKISSCHRDHNFRSNPTWTQLNPLSPTCLGFELTTTGS